MAEHQASKHCLHALKSDGICLIGFESCLGMMTPFFFLISPFCNGNVWAMNVPQLYFWTKSTDEKQFCSHEDQSLAIPDLDDKEGEN
jgi:hypothetical protein